MTSHKNFLRVIVLVVAALATCAAGKLGDDAGKADTVVAVVNGERITEGDLDTMLSLMDGFERRAYEGPEGRKLLLDVLIKNKILMAEAAKVKLEKDPQVKKDLEDARMRIIASTYFNRYIGATLGIPDDEVKRYYDAHKEEFSQPAKVTLRHILVDSPDAAEQVLARLKAGEDFAAVAAEVSLDEYTSHQGGLIGEVSEEYTPFQVGNCEGYAATVFALKDGEISAPVKSDRGYHIFKVEAKTEKTYAPLENVSYRIRERILVPEADARAYFDAHRDEYVIEEGVLARRLVVKDEAAARDLLRRARAGEDFESLVKLYSIDSSTKNNGGLIGWVRPGGYIQGIGENAEIEKALLGAKENDYVGPFKLDDGYHVYRVDRRRDFRRMEFDEVKDRVYAQLIDERRRDYYDRAFRDLEVKNKVERFGWARTHDDMSADELMREAEGAATPVAAVRAYEAFVKRFPDHPQADKALFMAGFLYSEELKDYATAKDKFRALLSTYPRSEYVKDARWMIEHMGEEDMPLPPGMSGSTETETSNP